MPPRPPLLPAGYSDAYEYCYVCVCGLNLNQMQVPWLAWGCGERHTQHTHAPHTRTQMQQCCTVNRYLTANSKCSKFRPLHSLNLEKTQTEPVKAALCVRPHPVPHSAAGWCPVPPLPLPLPCPPARSVPQDLLTDFLCLLLRAYFSGSGKS